MAGPEIKIQYDDEGAARVRDNLVATEKEAAKLQKELGRMAEKSRLAELRSQSDEYKAAVERLAKAQGKLKDATGGASGATRQLGSAVADAGRKAQQGAQGFEAATKRLERWKQLTGLALLNQVKELATSTAGLARSIYDLAKSNATEDQAEQFEAFDEAVGNAIKTLGELIAGILTDTGALDLMTAAVESLSAVMDAASPIIEGASYAIRGVAEVATAIINPLHAMESAFQAIHGGSISVANALAIQRAELEKLQTQYEQEKVRTQLGSTREELYANANAAKEVYENVAELSRQYDSAETAAAKLFDTSGKSLEATVADQKKQLELLDLSRQALVKLKETTPGGMSGLFELSQLDADLAEVNAAMEFQLDIVHNLRDLTEDVIDIEDEYTAAVARTKDEATGLLDVLKQMRQAQIEAGAAGAASNVSRFVGLAGAASGAASLQGGGQPFGSGLKSFAAGNPWGAQEQVGSAGSKLSEAWAKSKNDIEAQKSAMDGLADAASRAEEALGKTMDVWGQFAASILEGIGPLQQAIRTMAEVEGGLAQGMSQSLSVGASVASAAADAWGASVETRAAIQAAFEYAMGLATAFLNPAESISHFTAAGLLTAIAGGAFGTESKGGGGKRAGSSGASAGTVSSGSRPTSTSTPVRETAAPSRQRLIVNWTFNSLDPRSAKGLIADAMVELQNSGMAGPVDIGTRQGKGGF